jgi:glyoxylase-like metal-dependent hydrolase (beta-lactamase superfamily II)
MEIVRGIHLFPNFGANVYLLLGEGITLVDTGWPGNAKRILSYLSSLGYEPSDVSDIVLTHCHIDRPLWRCSRGQEEDESYCCRSQE